MVLKPAVRGVTLMNSALMTLVDPASVRQRAVPLQQREQQPAGRAAAQPSPRSTSRECSERRKRRLARAARPPRGPAPPG